MTAANENDVNDIELLLPWHAAGTLSRRDKQRVEAALAKVRREAFVPPRSSDAAYANRPLPIPQALRPAKAA